MRGPGRSAAAPSPVDSPAPQSLNGSCSGSPPLLLREGAWLGPLSLPALPAAACTCGAAQGLGRNSPTCQGVDRTVPVFVTVGLWFCPSLNLYPLSLGNPDEQLSLAQLLDSHQAINIY